MHFEPLSSGRPGGGDGGESGATGPRTAEASALLALATFVLWIVCAAVDVAGLLLPYPQARPAVRPPPAVQAEIVHLDVVKEDAAPPPPPPPGASALRMDNPAPPKLAPAAPPAPEQLAAAEAPPLPAVAAPSPAIAFALPVEGLVQIVDANQAGHRRVSTIATTAPASSTGRFSSGNPSAGAAAPSGNTPPAITHLVLGQGEGIQPPPEYPREAALAGEQGTVGLRFSVDESGRVLAVEIASPCRWPLLNQAAARTVRQQWRFSPGPPRAFEVSIEFQLH